VTKIEILPTKKGLGVYFFAFLRVDASFFQESALKKEGFIKIIVFWLTQPILCPFAKTFLFRQVVSNNER